MKCICINNIEYFQDFVSRRNLTEFGNLMLVEKRSELEGGDVKLRLPGVKQGDMADRNFKPEVCYSGAIGLHRFLLGFTLF